jgi:exodeoxyribonuclease VII small subunit
MMDQSMAGSGEELTYTSAIAELERIIGDMEDSSVSVDVLSEKVKRASFLLQFCRARLTSTEEEINKILKGFDKESGD